MQWIWLKDASKKINTYAAFRQNFSYNGEPVSLELSAADEYAVFVNGNFVDCGQYDDYPDLKFLIHWIFPRFVRLEIMNLSSKYTARERRVPSALPVTLSCGIDSPWEKTFWKAAVIPFVHPWRPMKAVRLSGFLPSFLLHSTMMQPLRTRECGLTPSVWTAILH